MNRIVQVEEPHHVTQRGNNRQPVFRVDGDRILYLELIREYAAQFRLRILGYCLMPNHVHFVVTPEHDDSMAKVFHRAHTEYSLEFNRRYGRCGHLWQNRYYSCPMDRYHLWTALRYIERNPVRAGLAPGPFEWAWSSARAHSLGASDVHLDLDLEAWRYRYQPSQWAEFVAWDDPAAAAELRLRTRSGRRWAAAIP